MPVLMWLIKLFLYDCTKKPRKDGCEKLQRLTGTVQNPIESQIKVMSPSVIEKSKVKNYS